MTKKRAIQASNLGKRYTIGTAKDGTLRASLSNIFRSEAKKGDDFWALKNLNFEINQGDVIGIVGKNGAGKSTLLKLLSQITKPTTGRIEIHGRVASLLEVGTGFHPELTGRENIFLNGTILGMSRKEVKAKFDEIVEFSGVEKFIDTPVKRYSSGMYVRLAFAVAAHLEPEILIIDEVLAVGDAEFQKKCLGKMEDVAKQGRTVLFVSHQLGSVRKLCSKGILLNHGEIQCAGDIEEVLLEYSRNQSSYSAYTNEKPTSTIHISNADFTTHQNEFQAKDKIRTTFTVSGHENVDHPVHILVRVKDELEQIVFSSEMALDKAKKEYTLTFPAQSLVKGVYGMNSILYQPAVQQFENLDRIFNFEIIDNAEHFSHLEGFDIGKTYIPQLWD